MHKRLLYILLSAGIILMVAMALAWYNFFGQNVTPLNKRAVILIPANAGYEQVTDTLFLKLSVKNKEIFNLVARKMGYPEKIKPGRYVIDKSLSYNALIGILRAGRQTPIRLTFNNVRTMNDIASRIGNQIEADSASIIAFFSDTANFRADGFSRENIISVFIPNTYEIYWNMSPKGLYNRMLREYNSFWNDTRLSKAKDIKLSPQEVSTLASIIDEEAAKNDEKPRIAGVYLNRLRLGIPLQADPTIKFAMNDFTLTRILTKYLLFDSPYNTYNHTGLPPGPIGCATIQGIDAVLNAEKHDYLFFVARADFSGYHYFSRTLAEHNRYAIKYQKELNARRIYK